LETRFIINSLSTGYLIAVYSAIHFFCGAKITLLLLETQTSR